MINIRFTVVVAVAVGIYSCAQLPAKAASAAQPGSWGVNVQTLYRGPALEKLGAQWVRIALRWDQIERTAAGRYDWSDADKTVNFYVSNGFHVVCILSLEKLAPVYAASAQNQDAISNAIARWMGAAAQRYKGKGIVWEIGNEPEMFPMGNYWNHPNIYAAMAKLSAAAIKQADPTGKVAALSVAWVDRDFVTRALAAGLLAQGNIDYLSFHGYHRWTIEPESGLADDVAWLRSQAAAATSSGKQVPDVIDSECGYSILPFQATKSKDAWRVSVYTEDAQAAYIARHFIEEIYLKIPISIWYKDMNGEQQFSLYYADDADPRGLRPSGHMFANLAQLLPDSPEALQNNRFVVAIKPKSTSSAAVAAQLHIRSFLRQSSSGQHLLLIAVWNAVEAFDGKILATRTITDNQVFETWRNIKPTDPVTIPSQITIDGLTGAAIKAANITTFSHGNSTQQTAKLDTANGSEGATLDVSATSTPTILTITYSGGPSAPSELHVSP